MVEASVGSDERAWLEEILETAATSNASDVHLVPGEAPRLRIAGELASMPRPPLEGPFIADLITAIVPASRRDRLAHGEVDFGYTDSRGRRHRVSAFRERRGKALAFRILGAAPPTLEALRLPPDILRAIYARSGLVLFAGAAGQGKTTTLAAVLQELCRRRPVHLITLEDPVEYALEPGVAWLEQREVGRHCDTFDSGLRDALDSEPDAIAIGELRDARTIRVALEAAEAGILVLATVHAHDVTRAIGRIVDAFEPEDRASTRMALAGTLRMAVAQTLLRERRGGARVPAVEVVHGCTPVSTLVRDGKEHELATTIEASRGRGMRLLDDSLLELVQSGQVSADEARYFSVHKEVFARRLGAGPRTGPA